MSNRDDLLKALATLSSLGFCVAKIAPQPNVPKSMRRKPESKIVAFKEVMKEYDKQLPS